MRRNLVSCLCCALSFCPSAALAVPYCVSYEGNDFPENEAWERVYGDENGPEQGGSERSIEDGWLVLDSLRDHLIYDTYFFRRPLNPEPGETFIAEWRVDVVQSIGVLPDAGLAIARDGQGTLAFQIGTDHLRNRREDYVLPLTPGVPHTFRVESPDMLSYSLFIDGVFARAGEWDLESLNESYVAFGDGAFGGGITSLSRWDVTGTVSLTIGPDPGSSRTDGAEDVRVIDLSNADYGELVDVEITGEFGRILGETLGSIIVDEISGDVVVGEVFAFSFDGGEISGSLDVLSLSATCNLTCTSLSSLVSRGTTGIQAGNITINGDFDGTIDLTSLGTYSGTLIVHGDITGTGRLILPTITKILEIDGDLVA